MFCYYTEQKGNKPAILLAIRYFLFCYRAKQKGNKSGLLSHKVNDLGSKLEAFLGKKLISNEKQLTYTDYIFELIKDELAKNEIYRAKSIAEKNLNRFLNEKVV